MQFVAKEDGLRVPIKSWITKDIFSSSSTLYEQACNIAKMNHAFHHVALMPDAHAGYGMPIGGVLALKGAVCPSLSVMTSDVVFLLHVQMYLLVLFVVR
jgi:tRNA-splicing ligase RtcB